MSAQIRTGGSRESAFDITAGLLPRADILNHKSLEPFNSYLFSQVGPRSRQVNDRLDDLLRWNVERLSGGISSTALVSLTSWVKILDQGKVETCRAVS